MAKPLGEKSRLIRAAIVTHMNLSNSKLAELLNESPDRAVDHIEVRPQDVAQQKQIMKKAGSYPVRNRKTQGNPVGRPRIHDQLPAEHEVNVPVEKANAVDVVEQVFLLAQQCGGMEQLKRLVDRLADAHRM